MIQKKILLNAAIVLLIVFIGIQSYGIVGKTSVNGRRSNGAGDSVAVPVQINVLNGCGISGVGITMTNYCRAAGYDVVEMGNYKNFNVETTVIIDRSGKMELSKTLAQQIGISPKNVVQQFSTEQLVTASVVIGKDYKKLRPWLNEKEL